ncbi:protein grindelwald isoform X1 [Mycetomoellerius zeteki]|nr:PREDICTED: protein grindelwald isoform X1 [Trachymyrmex zeteki]
MTLIVSVIVVLSVLANVLLADLDPRGTRCGEILCDISQYCSPFDLHCKPCADACNVTSHNYQPDECKKDCQFYLHDQRYTQRMDQSRQYDDLREEVEKLKYRFVITTILTCFSLLGMLYLLARTLIRWKRIQESLQTLFRRNIKVKQANKNKVQDDVEAATNKQNGLKLTIPSISATVEQESKIENNNSSSNSNSNGINTTPNTTSTPLSRRHASEDTTLDYAYDNPAMTPSPDSAQLKTKARESSF